MGSYFKAYANKKPCFLLPLYTRILWLTTADAPTCHVSRVSGVLSSTMIFHTPKSQGSWTFKQRKKILILTRFEIHFRVDFLCENLKIFHRGSRNRTTWHVTCHEILCDWSFRTISFRFIFRIFIFSRSGTIFPIFSIDFTSISVYFCCCYFSARKAGSQKARRDWPLVHLAGEVRRHLPTVTRKS